MSGRHVLDRRVIPPLAQEDFRIERRLNFCRGCTPQDRLSVTWCELLLLSRRTNSVSSNMSGAQVVLHPAVGDVEASTSLGIASRYGFAACSRALDVPSQKVASPTENFMVLCTSHKCHRPRVESQRDIPSLALLAGMSS